MSDKIIIYKDLYYIEDREYYGVAMANDCKPFFAIYLEDDKDDLGLTKVVVKLNVHDISEYYYSKFYTDKLDILKEKVTTRVADLFNRDVVDIRILPLIIAECETEVFGE